MDSRIALAGRSPDVYGALMRGYQGAAYRQQDRQQQEDRAALIQGLTERYGAGYGALARLAPDTLKMEQEQAEYAQKQRDAAAPVISQVAELLKPIPQEQRGELLSGFAKEYAATNPQGAQFLLEAFDDVSDQGLDMKMRVGKMSAPPVDDAYGNVIYARDKTTGQTVAIQPTKSRDPNIIQLPENLEIIDPVKFMNTGSNITAFDPRNPTNTQNVAQVTPPPEAMPGFRADVVTAEADAKASTRKGQLELGAAEREEAEAVLAKQQASIDRLDIISAAQDLRADPAISRVYGTVQGAAPSLRQDVVNAEAKVKRVVDLLTLANLGKMSGVLSETDIKILANAGSILQNRRISPALAKQELDRVEKIMQKYEALMNPGQAEGVPDGVDADLWEAMTPEERALWK